MIIIGLVIFIFSDFRKKRKNRAYELLDDKIINNKYINLKEVNE